jgi:PilZ domain
MTDWRRQHPRYAIELDVIVETEGEQITCRTDNLSRGGLCVLAPRALPISTVCRLQVALVFSENQFSEHLAVPATVVWCTPLGGAHQVGFKFAPLDAEVRGYLEVFMRFLDEQTEDA